MKAISFLKLMILIYVAHITSFVGAAEKQDSITLIKQLNQTAIPITLKASENYEQFHFLENSIKDSRIVGLGEATHGTHEFMKGNMEVMKYLITNMDFKVIVFETQFGCTDLINRYITGEEVSLNDAMYKLGFLTLLNKNMLSFVEWLKTYNKARAEDDQVLLHGCDVQSSRYVIDDLMEFLEANNSLSLDLNNGLTTLKEKLYKLPKKDLKSTVKQLNKAMKPLDASAEIKHIQKVVNQSADLATASILGGILKRDKYMAETCKWIYDNTGNKKMAVYAHNMHIAQAADNSMKKRMGQHLQQFFPDYFAIGTAFNKGDVGIVGTGFEISTYQNAVHGSYDWLFRQSNHLSFFLDFGKIGDNELYEFISTKNISRNPHGGTSKYPDDKANVNLNYRKHTLSKSYDALLFFNSSTPNTYFLKEEEK